MADKYEPIIRERVKESLRDLASRKTQVELAEYLDVHPRSMNRYLNQGYIEQDKLISIARFLDCSPNYLKGKSDTKGHFSDYEFSNYNVHDCVCGLLTLRGYSPRDFSSNDIASLFLEFSVAIERYTTLKNIQPASNDSANIADTDIDHHHYKLKATENKKKKGGK